MDPQKRIGRMVGVLILLHLAIGLITPFVILDRIRKPTGFLAGAASNAGQLRAAILLFFIGSGFAIAIAVAAWPVVRRYSSAMALWLFAVGIAGFTLQMVDNGALLSLLSLSQEYAKAEAGKAEVFESLAILANAIRKWAHFMYLLVGVFWIFLFCVTLLRFGLIPRVLSVCGALASMLQIYGVTMRAIFEFPMEMRLAMPLAPAYFAIALWLIAKGFNGGVAGDERFNPAAAQATL